MIFVVALAPGAALAQSAKPSLDEAIKLYEAHRFADAERVTRALLPGGGSHDMSARLLLGWSIWNQGRYDDALLTFKSVLHDAPSHRRPRWDEYAALNLPREIESIENPDLDQARLGLAWCYLKEGWPRSALALFDRLVPRAPAWDAPYLGRGYARLSLGRTDDARADIDAYATRTQTRWLAERALGDLELAAERPAAAVPHYERALALRPQWTEGAAELAWARAGGRAALDRAWALYRTGKSGDAAPAFEAVLKSAALPRDGRVSALNGLAWARLALGDHERAARAFGDALAALPGDGEATSGLGWVALARKDWTGAEQAFAKALRAIPRLQPALDGYTALRRARFGTYDEAWARYWAGKPGEARALFVRLRTTPGDLPPGVLPHVGAGVAWADVALHQPDKAEPVFRELAAAGGASGAEGTAGLGWVALERRQFVEARRLFSDAQRAAPDQPAAARGLVELRKRELPELATAWAAYFAGRYAEAAPAFERLTSRAELAVLSRADARRGLAWSLTWLGRADEAARQFATLLDTVQDADALHGAGAALTRAGRAREALDPLRRALALNPRSVDVHTALGWALLRSGDAKAAEAAFLAAYELAPASAEVNRSIGWARARANRAADSFAPFRYALAEAPAAVDDAEFRALLKSAGYQALKRDLAWGYVRWHGFERARALFEELVRDDRDDGDARFGLGYTRYRMQQYAEADRDLERAIAARRRPGVRVVWVVFRDAGAFPILTDPWSIRGWVALFRNDLTAARTRFRDSLDRDPELVSSLAGLGQVLERSDDRVGAHEVYLRASEIYPTYPGVVAGLRATEPRGAAPVGR